MLSVNTSEMLLVAAVVGATLGFVVAATDSTSSDQSAFNNVDFVRECEIIIPLCCVFINCNTLNSSDYMVVLL